MKINLSATVPSFPENYKADTEAITIQSSYLTFKQERLHSLGVKLFRQLKLQFYFFYLRERTISEGKLLYRPLSYPYIPDRKKV